MECAKAAQPTHDHPPIEPLADLMHATRARFLKPMEAADTVRPIRELEVQKSEIVYRRLAPSCRGCWSLVNARPAPRVQELFQTGVTVPVVEIERSWKLAVPVPAALHTT